MARNFNGSTDRIDYGNIDASAAQAQSFSALVYGDNASVGTEFVFITHISGDSGYSIHIRLTGNRAIGFIVACTGQNLDCYSVNFVYTHLEWFHLFITWDGSITATNAHIYVNNVEVGYSSQVNMVNPQFPPVGKWSLGGAIYNDTLNFEGDLAEIGWWNRILSAGERNTLAKGFSPRFIQRGLKFAPDLIRHQRDPISGQVGILDGTTVRAHPRIIQPCGVL